MATKRKTTKKAPSRKANGAQRAAGECRLKRKAPGEGMAPFDLEEDEVNRRALEIARLEQHYEYFKDSKAAQLREWREEEKGFTEQIGILSDQVNARQEWRDARQKLPGVE